MFAINSSVASVSYRSAVSLPGRTGYADPALASSIPPRSSERLAKRLTPSSMLHGWASGRHAGLWAALIGKIRELQIASGIADRGGTLVDIDKTFPIPGGRREFDVIFQQGGATAFAEVKTGGATLLNRGSDRCQRTLDNFVAQRDFAVSQGASYRLYADEFSSDMQSALRAAGIQFAQSGTILR